MKPDRRPLVAALERLNLTPAELALCTCYAAVPLPADAAPAGAGWQIVVATALLDRLARTHPEATALLRPLLAHPSVTGVLATAGTRDGKLRQMRAAITGEDPEALRPKERAA